MEAFSECDCLLQNHYRNTTFNLRNSFVKTNVQILKTIFEKNKLYFKKSIPVLESLASSLKVMKCRNLLYSNI